MSTVAPIREERIKMDKDSLDVWDDIRRYAADPTLVVSEDDAVRLKWYGIYAQKPNSAGHYMMRIKIAAGRVSADQLDRIAELSRKYGHNLADITTRQTIQLHWLRMADMPAILDVVYKDMGLFQEFSCGDAPRAVTGCPLAGIAADEHLDTSGLANAVSDLWFAERRDFSNLPRKFKTSVGGCRIHCHLPQINDIGFFGVTRADGSRGLGVAVGGGLRNTPHLAQSLRVFVPPEKKLVVDIARHIARLYRGYDDLRLKRLHARFKFHIADVGWKAFRDELEASLGYQLEHDDRIEFPEGAAHNQDHIGVGRQNDGRAWVGVPVPCGRVSGDQLAWFAGLARSYGVDTKGRIVFTPKQNLILLDIDPARTGELAQVLAAAGFPIDAQLASSFNTCTGSEFCNLAVTETKATGALLLKRLSTDLKIEEPFFIAMTGCPNSCAHYWLGDIGVTGAKVKWQGQMVDAFHVLLGARLGRDPQFSYEVVSGEGQKGRIKIPAALLHLSVQRLMGAYRAERQGDDRFGDWVRRQAMPRLAELVIPPEFAAEAAAG